MKTSSRLLIVLLAVAGCATAPKKEIVDTPLPPPADKPAPMPSLHLDDIYFETGKADLRPEAKTLKKLAKLSLRLTWRPPAARTAAHPSWISIAGVLAGCGEVAERSKAAVC